ncbi:hypothetical protein CEXT_716261 [Caerostris extrusa]|uniref:Uncharacterized protein n=1 Tax=Caerostris extrusa TaxID=172846 RepID=A0AAV4V3C2_CAEEX|nr:hypothetical protein CEXT_716261 [Caerostris extrusa]
MSFATRKTEIYANGRTIIHHIAHLQFEIYVPNGIGEGSILLFNHEERHVKSFKCIVSIPPFGLESLEPATLGSETVLNELLFEVSSFQCIGIVF